MGGGCWGGGGGGRVLGGGVSVAVGVTSLHRGPVGVVCLLRDCTLLH